MMTDTLSFEQAWAGYRQWEHRMPHKPPFRRPRRVSGLVEILDAFDAVILDNFGVMSLGGPAIPQGHAAMAAIRQAGLGLRVITNDGGSGLDAMVAAHRARGIDLRDCEIIPGYRLLERALARHTIDRPWGVVGLEPLPLPALTASMIPLAGAGPDLLDATGGIVLLDTGRWNEADHNGLVAALRREPRPVIVCNPDLTAPYPDFLSLEPGWYGHRLADACGLKPDFLGKPFPDIYDLALDGLDGIRRDRVLAVGDTPHTDILGAHAAGLRSLLVETGFTRGRNARALMACCGIAADYVARTI